MYQAAVRANIIEANSRQAEHFRHHWLLHSLERLGHEPPCAALSCCCSCSRIEMKGPARLPARYELPLRYKYYDMLAIGVFYNIRAVNVRTCTHALK